MRRLRAVTLGLSALVLAGGPIPAASGDPIVVLPDLPTAHATVAPGAIAHTAAASRTPVAHASAVGYDGGPVLHANRTHLIFWQPTGSGLTFDPGYVPLVEQFLGDVAADSHMTTNLYGITGQFTDENGPAAYAASYGGAIIDSDPLPTSECVEPVLTGPGWTTCVTDAQFQTELQRVIAANNLPTTSTDAYLFVTPRGFGSCEDSSSSACALGGSATGYCGYHSSTADGVLYAVIPYNAMPGHCQSTNPRPNGSTADPTLSTLSHEHAEILTDPLGNGWVDNSGNEIADVCITSYGPALGGTADSRWDEVINGHHYWLQELYSRIDGACDARPKPDTASIATSGRIAAALPVAFTGRAAMPGGTIAAYEWSFGDGRTGRGHTINHSYARPGTVRVTLRITDSAGNWTYASRTLTVTRGSARDRGRSPRRGSRSPGARSAGSARTTSR